jgi:hypothetical protein
LISSYFFPRVKRLKVFLKKKYYFSKFHAFELFESKNPNRCIRERANKNVSNVRVIKADKYANELISDVLAKRMIELVS